ncbi:MAG: HAD family hydrolase [Gammaproteobacteria bacterium]|nr:HAD family hydrolase [Gammaproteobacteria bacterium]
MSLAIFDLDNTLLGGDSDYLWGEFLVEQGIVDGEFYLRENERYYEEYKAGTLDIFAYQRFCLAPIANREPEELQRWHAQFMTEKIAPIMLPAARELLTKHREQEDELLIITATNRFITGPIASAFGVDSLLATEPEQKDGRYTGDIVGIPCFQDGKVKRLEQWLQQTGHNLAGSWFYSDSRNDLPLLEMVEHPVAVDADETLESHAKSKGWEIISLR